MKTQKLSDLSPLLIPDIISAEEVAPGYPILEVNNQHARARIALHGAHLIDFTPHNQPSVIFTSRKAIFKEGKAIRGGIPICWPWFGAHPPTANTETNNTETNLPAHGFARTSFWKLMHTHHSEEQTTLLFSLSPSPLRPAPYSQLEAQLSIQIGTSLFIELTTLNHSHTPVTISEALHSYFAVQNTTTTQVLELDGCDYLDTTTSPETKHQQKGDIYLPGETDRIYTTPLQPPATPIVIDDTQRAITLIASEAQNAVVWNPGKEKGEALTDLDNDEINRFVCVEPANVRAHSISVPAHSAHSISVTITSNSSNI